METQSNTVKPKHIEVSLKAQVEAFLKAQEKKIKRHAKGKRKMGKRWAL